MHCVECLCEGLILCGMTVGEGSEVIIVVHVSSRV